MVLTSLKDTSTTESSFFLLNAAEWHSVYDGKCLKADWTDLFAKHLNKMYPLCPITFIRHRFGNRFFFKCEAKCSIKSNHPFLISNDISVWKSSMDLLRLSCLLLCGPPNYSGRISRPHIIRRSEKWHAAWFRNIRVEIY